MQAKCKCGYNWFFEAEYSSCKFTTHACWVCYECKTTYKQTARYEVEEIHVPEHYKKYLKQFHFEQGELIGLFGFTVKTPTIQQTSLLDTLITMP